MRGRPQSLVGERRSLKWFSSCPFWILLRGNLTPLLDDSLEMIPSVDVGALMSLHDGDGVCSPHTKEFSCRPLVLDLSKDRVNTLESPFCGCLELEIISLEEPREEPSLAKEDTFYLW